MNTRAWGVLAESLAPSDRGRLSLASDREVLAKNCLGRTVLKGERVKALRLWNGRWVITEVVL